MIREIEKPKIDFKFWIEPCFKYYYDEETGEYFFENNCKSKFYFNLNGQIHRIGKSAIEWNYGGKKWIENGKLNRLDGPASYFDNYEFYWINNKTYSKLVFAEKTNHLICRNCGGFCRQGCFF